MTKRIIDVVLSIIILLSLIASTAIASIIPPANVNRENDSLLFGAYEQSWCYIEGLEYVDDGEEPIEWIVLEQRDSRLLLVTKYAIDYRQYDNNRRSYTWQYSGIRQWLNRTFINNAFTPEEQAAILTVDIETGSENIEKGWPSSAKEYTQDKVFLLSWSEAKKYLADDNVPLCEHVSTNGGTIFAEDTTWWLRSSGKKEDEACYIGHGKNESGWLSDWRCIRPAMWIDISQFDWDNSRYALAKKADELDKEKKYAEAFAITDSLGTYWESKIYSAFYRFEYAEDAASSGDYNEAIKRIIDTRDYINNHFSSNNYDFGTNEKVVLQDYFATNDLLLEYKYQLALQMEESGNTEEAASLFTEIGQYKDSMYHLRLCLNKENIKTRWLTTYDAARNTGLDKGFAEEKEITDGDPHLDWSLGRFMLSGFTDYKMEDDIPVFFKTPGDNLILMFDLNQDIDALNGDKSLSINKDTNGRDKKFGINKAMEFGRGMLLVRHTIESTGDELPVQKHADFLASKGGTGANTMVEIKEEGLYEVALDYEIKKDELFDKFYNYKISCKFKVRNGSGMFFMFDLASGSELQDYSRATEGFRISLANSSSLGISFTRYSLDQEGRHLDARQNGLAADGDQFDKVGYYEITVTNKETGTTLMKHIFVGSPSDLIKYAGVEESLSKFVK